MEHIVLISKDVLRKSFLPVYGNTYWKTPNIDELASKGTVFKRHYTAAPSTAMAFTSMFTGLYPYQTERATYVPLETSDIEEGSTLFDFMDRKGYSCHLMWSTNYITMAEKFSKCYGKNTVHHDKLAFNQYLGPHAGDTPIVDNDELLENTYSKIIDEIDTIDRSVPVFLWVHLPHTFLGRSRYGGDMDVFDRFVGDIRKRFGDKIYITADHGSNDGKDGKTGYGFDLYESAICIPLITPRLDGMTEVDFPTSNIDLMSLIGKEKVVHHDYVISDTAYYAQPHRKTAIILGNYKFIYDKAKQKEFLYDVIEDPSENINLCEPLMYDVDRRRHVHTEQVLFYPYWDKSKDAYRQAKNVFAQIWKTASFTEEKKNKVINEMKKIYHNIESLFIK